MQEKSVGTDLAQSKKNKGFSFFQRPIKNIRPLKTLTLSEVYDMIISSVYEKYTIKLRDIKDVKLRKAFKCSNFDYVTFAGTFSERKENALIEPSGLFVIDIDHLGKDLLMALIERLKADKVLCPQLIFISPSGDGLKIIVNIDYADVSRGNSRNTLGDIWHAINIYFSLEYRDIITPNEKNDFIDASGKDASRACFLCHDPSTYLNLQHDSILGKEFIELYRPSYTEKQESLPSKDAYHYKHNRINPLTSLTDLAKRHLNDTDNHHTELIAFVGAAKNLCFPKHQIVEFIRNFVHISQDSTYVDFNKINGLVDDIYLRYASLDKNIIYLSPVTFAYKILHFTFQKKNAPFIPKSLCRVAVENILKDAGFAKRKIGNDFTSIHIKDCVIKEVSGEMLINHFNLYIDNIKEDYSFVHQDLQYFVPINAIKEIYLRDSHNIFNEKWQRHLQIHDDPILKDTEKEMFFFFKNGLVVISADGLKIENWSDKKGVCIWAEQLIDHDFIYKKQNTESHFYKFLNNVTNNDEDRMLTMFTGIGYLLHHYFNESEGQAVVFYDEAITDLNTPMGGTGKGLIMNAIKEVRNVCKIDGKHFDINNRFKWESITPSTQIVWLDDVKPDFEFSILHSNLTDGWTVERKHKSQYHIEAEDSPKTSLCSNSIIKGKGSTNVRRQFVIELSDYYSRQIIHGEEKPIIAEHGQKFFSQKWSEKEWDLFYSVIIDCGLMYLKCGLVFFKGVNVDLNRFRQETELDFPAWIEEQNFKVSEKYETKKFYNSYVDIYYGDNPKLSQRKFNSYLKEFAAYRGWIIENSQSNCISYFKFKESI